MASQEHLDKMQLRQNYRNLWHTTLMNSISADTPCNQSNPNFIFLFCLTHFTFLLDSNPFASVYVIR
ncbi:hypothetical protein HanHA300_Chr03g0108421 [Helianthus annuus]|nr:hypothetical protein HanHA300_Chr03g0108421 [Helianthus annuus]KAJ0775215.1 hypothetical protein HanOQP8_Chr03g0120471 [Helianthus annuus]